MICQPCDRALAGMSAKSFYGTAFGHKNCTCENLLNSGTYDEATARKFCLCYSQGHPKRLKEEDDTELPKEYTSRLSKLREEEKDMMETRQEIQKRREKENEEEVVKST